MASQSSGRVCMGHLMYWSSLSKAMRYMGILNFSGCEGMGGEVLMVVSLARIGMCVCMCVWACVCVCVCVCVRAHVCVYDVDALKSGLVWDG